MFHVKIEIEQHKNGISLQYKTRNNIRKPDDLFSSDIEKSQFQDLFPRISKTIESPSIEQPLQNVLSTYLFNVTKILYYLYIFRNQQMFLPV